MPVLRLFAAAREAAGVARADFEGTTVADLLAAAESSFGERFSAVLKQSRVWVNGEPATPETPVTGHDVVAVLPPVSGGAGDVGVAPTMSSPPVQTRRDRVPSRPPPAAPPRLDPLAKPMP
ncbi:MAG: MoaD/ThiS family protein, partial [Actinomycetota bacterium]|nr:MoaD/ThiS family protein [Actinomycetota bacterium]